MEQNELRTLLTQVAEGSLTVEQAMLQMKTQPFEDLGFAKIDHHRALRQGVAEVIYGAGKTPEQIAAGDKNKKSRTGQRGLDEDEKAALAAMMEEV